MDLDAVRIDSDFFQIIAICSDMRDEIQETDAGLKVTYNQDYERYTINFL